MCETFIAGHNVRLRDWGDADRRGYAELVSDPSVMRHISDGRPRGGGSAACEVEMFRRELRAQGWSRWAVRAGSADIFAGYAGFARTDLGIDFGQRYLRRYWGSAIPFLAAHLSLTYGFEHLGWERVYTFTKLTNERAIRFNIHYLGLDPGAGELCETPYGPHLRIDVTAERFRSQKEKNDRRAARYGKRIR